MLADHSVTDVIAALIGLYVLAGGVGVVTDRNVWSSVINGVADSPALGYMAGILAFAIGGAIVGMHNRWGTPLEAVVSLIGWAALIEGVLMLALRQPFIGFFARLSPSLTALRLIAGIMVLAGAALIYAALL